MAKYLSHVARKVVRTDRVEGVKPKPSALPRWRLHSFMVFYVQMPPLTIVSHGKGDCGLTQMILKTVFNIEIEVYSARHHLSTKRFRFLLQDALSAQIRDCPQCVSTSGIEATRSNSCRHEICLSMDLEVVSDKPGACPKYGMALEPRCPRLRLRRSSTPARYIQRSCETNWRVCPMEVETEYSLATAAI